MWWDRINPRAARQAIVHAGHRVTLPCRVECDAYGWNMIRVLRADITTLSVDAIVNAANNKLVMGGGVAGAIRKKGGKAIEDEVVRKGPIEIGEADGISLPFFQIA